MPALTFDLPQAWQIGVPLSLLAVLLQFRRARRRGQARDRTVVLALLRFSLLLCLVFLLSRPVHVNRPRPDGTPSRVAVLIDRSESMSLEEPGGTRYMQALELLREQLAAALEGVGWRIDPLLFAEQSEPGALENLNHARIDGRRSNLAGALVQAVHQSATPPLAIIALTDGAANDPAENTRAASALLHSGTPVIAIGFGSDTGASSLSLRRVEAPSSSGANHAFTVSAHLEMQNGTDLPAFDLVLLRNGSFQSRKTIQTGGGSRYWIENFTVTEPIDGAYTYTVQLLLPDRTKLVSASTVATASVRVISEKELRVLYVQGALTWDYKFANLALRQDPGIKITGLTRTSRHSVFRQNVEGAGELVSGFPETLAELAPFRVVVLSNLKPSDLSTAQQELLAQFCGELGGGILMIGGAATFDISWHGSRLEKLLPVVFSTEPTPAVEAPFRLEFSDEALRHPVFRVTDGAENRSVLAQLPAFTQFGRVDSAKPGATTWATHPTDEGPSGKRILMAVQRYGAGLSAVLCVQNFWRWRMAKEADPNQFDRFWRQLFRFLSESSRQQIAIELAEQDLSPKREVRFTVEKQPDPKDVQTRAAPYTVVVQDAGQKELRRQRVELAERRPVPLSFTPAEAGLFTVQVRDSSDLAVASRTIEINEINLEFQNTARNMETLRQWAGLSRGLALKAEECPPAGDLVRQIQAAVRQAEFRRIQRRPLRLEGWMLAFMVTLASSEWLLRRKWGLR